MNRQDIKDNLQTVLDSTHWHQKKCEIEDKPKGLKFACPVCHDSAQDTTKKRGGIWFDKANPYFYCHHECGGMSLERFFKFFNIKYTDEDLGDFFQTPINVKPTYRYDPREMALSQISQLAVPVSYIEEGYGCERIDPTHKVWSYLESRNLQQYSEYFRYWPKWNRLIILNTVEPPELQRSWNVDGYYDEVHCSVIGFQARSLDGKTPKYLTYTLEKICAEISMPYKPKPGTEEMIKKLSNTFFSTHVDWTSQVVITEGPIDSLFIENSIGLSGATKTNAKLDNNYLCQYLFDNDETGRREQTNKAIKFQKAMFDWRGLLRDIECTEELKDWNDVVNYCKESDITLPELNKYFI